MIYIGLAHTIAPQWDLYGLDITYQVPGTGFPGWDMYDLHDLRMCAKCDLDLGHSYVMRYHDLDKKS